ncbi:MAG: calcineurin-like phosphoesterase C-terminal domain-containing protein [Verrucomicrobiales bacterium]|nr:calcineurin-like phosphoesterase C-terminal domain-containing protein [Verrucomicrobiales bacterium]MCP5528310.1 calcineurin-like phosphoesterase C-terminal domain-containing protein [Verrucomicrobiales bacterium]
MKGMRTLTIVVGLGLLPLGRAADTSWARGVVYEDVNGNQLRDAGEPGLPGVLVSNQREVVKTDQAGRWQLPASEDCAFFVIKPTGWMTPVDAQQLPRFHYLHKPHGSPEVRFGGVPPTGPLPASIDFPLYRHPEPGRFQAVFFGDPQPRDQKEVDYIAHDVVEELIGTPAKFGVTLGDIMFDDLSLFENYNALIALIGIPWYNVIGNHDINYDAVDDRHSDETFERVYGPNYYSYAYGPVQFVVLDNVQWGGAKPAGTGKYTAGLGEDQLVFIENLLAHVPEDRLVLFMMHIPIMNMADRERLFRLIEPRPYTMSISGHTHWQAHFHLGEESGWRGAEPHHHMVNVTVCGSWWSGEPDELGIPHTTMGDGAPNGYSIITFDGQQAVVDFKASRRPADYQMNIQTPEVIPAAQAPETPVYVNVFGGSTRSTVDMRLDPDGDWIRLTKVLEEDPYFLELKRIEASGVALRGRELTSAKKSNHLWKGLLPANLAPGVHRIRVRSEDQYGRVFNGSRSIRIE